MAAAGRNGPVGSCGRGKLTFSPHDEQLYSARPWWPIGVRHLGHGTGRAVTHAANISCDLRSALDGGAAAAVTEVDGAETAGAGTVVGTGADR